MEKLFIFIVLIAFINCKIFRLQKCEKYQAEFSIIYREKKLTNGIFSRIKDADFIKCTVICFNYPKCESISVKNDGSECLIHHSSLNDSCGVYLEDAVGWMHAETPEVARNVGPVCTEKKPCLHGKCKDTCDDKGYQCTCDDKWLLLATNVCYGAKNDTFGHFSVSTAGILKGMKLVHVSGGTNCFKDSGRVTNFGCTWPSWENKIALFITSENRSKPIFPDTTVSVDQYGFYELIGYNKDSHEIIVEALNEKVNKEQIIKIWYGEDWIDWVNEYNNFGQHCVDVFAKLCDE